MLSFSIVLIVAKSRLSFIYFLLIIPLLIYYTYLGSRYFVQGSIFIFENKNQVILVYFYLYFDKYKMN
jgi:hypothetical protein